MAAMAWDPVEHGTSSWMSVEFALLVLGSIFTNSAPIYEQIIPANERHIVMTE